MLFIHKNKKNIVKIVWILFLLSLLSSLLIGIFLRYESEDLLRNIVDGSILFFSLFTLFAAVYKFKLNRYFKSLEGRVFGVLFIVILFSYLSEVYWILLERIFDASIGELYYNEWVNLGWIIASILIILLFLKIIKYYKIELTINKYLIWALVTLVLIIAFDYFAIQPILQTPITKDYTYTDKFIGDLLYPVVDLVTLIILIGIFLFLKNNKKARIWVYIIAGISIKAVTDLIYIIIVSNESYETGIHFMVEYGYILCSTVIGTALLKYNFKYDFKDFSKIQLNKSLVSILTYIRFNSRCMKMDVTKEFNITRKTTNVKLDKLEELGLITVEKDGRSTSITISEKGIDYMNYIEY